MLFHLYVYISPWKGFELTTLVVLDTDCIGSCKSNYYKITTSTLPPTLSRCQPNTRSDPSLLWFVIHLTRQDNTTLLFHAVFLVFCLITLCFLDIWGVTVSQNHLPVASKWRTLSHNVVSNTSRHERASNSTLVVIGTDCIGSCKSNYHKITTSTLPYLINIWQKHTRSC
jgi:hypothetical protein